MKRFLSFLSFFFLLGCANIVAPIGGAVDENPPQVTKLVPKNGTTNFKQKEINIYFNEFIQLKQAKQIVIAPNLENLEFKIKGKKLSILLPDTLPSATTININLSGHVVDYREGNVLEELNYVFSTANYLDSLTISGIVTDAVTNKALKGMLVGLYNQFSDSLVHNQRPDYYVKTKENGGFLFQNLPPKRFFIAAFLDSNANLKLDRAEMLAFSDKPITAGANNDSIYLQAFRTEALNNRIAELRATDSLYAKIKLAYPPLTSLNLSAQNKIIPNTDWVLQHDSIFLVIPHSMPDSSLITITEEGYFSETKPLRTNRRVPAIPKVLAIQTNFPKLPQLLLNVPHHPDTSNLKITVNDSILPFSLQKIDLLNYAILADYLIGLPHQLTYIQNNQQTNKYDTIQAIFTPKKYQELGTLLLPNLDSIVQLGYGFQILTEAGRLVQAFSKQTVLPKSISLIPSKYLVLFYRDDNNNGYLDVGSLKLNRQPERGFMLQNSVEIRADWEISLNWADFNISE